MLKPMLVNDSGLLPALTLPAFVLGPLELLLIVAVTLLIFGAKRLPELGKGLGKGLREFKSEIQDDPATQQPEQRKDSHNQ